jgi:hypothetical protein
VSDAVLSTATYATVIVTQENARATYAGALFAATSSATSTSAIVTLAATIQDITAVDPTQSAPNPIAMPGDIRKATVTFVNRDASNATLCTATIGLVNPADTKTARRRATGMQRSAAPATLSSSPWAS